MSKIEADTIGMNTITTTTCARWCDGTSDPDTPDHACANAYDLVELAVTTRVGSPDEDLIAWVSVMAWKQPRDVECVALVTIRDGDESVGHLLPHEARYLARALTRAADAIDGGAL